MVKHSETFAVDRHHIVWQTQPMFVALDVETANRDSGSICQIGMVLFDGEEPVEEFQTLINPQAQFEYGNIRIHGIRPEHVEAAPTFAEASGEIFSRMADQIVVAHSAGFDQGAVNKAAANYGLRPPYCQWLCSAKIARRAWHGELERFGLARMAEHLGVVFKHHDALEDARACGQVVVAASQKTGLSAKEWLIRVSQPTSAPNKPSSVPRPEPGVISRKALGHR